MLCGAAPVEASSGKTTRHRLNRGGDRQANAALYRIVVVRLRWDQPTKDYMARRLAEGKTKKEVIRCLRNKREETSMPRRTRVVSATGWLSVNRAGDSTQRRRALAAGSAQQPSAIAGCLLVQVQHDPGHEQPQPEEDCHRPQ